MCEKEIKSCNKKNREGNNIQRYTDTSYFFQCHLNIELLELSVRAMWKRAKNYENGKWKEQWHFLFS